MKKQFIVELKNKDNVASFFLLKRKEEAKTKNDKPYFKFEFADKSGSLEGRMWDNTESVPTRIAVGDIVYIEGSVSEWRGNLQINVNRMIEGIVGEYKINDMIRAVENIDEIYCDIRKMLHANLTDKFCAVLAESFFNDEGFVERFKKSPGARSWHNAYIGGLIEHTYEVMKIVLTMCEMYNDIDINIALIGAMLHDSGKMYELDTLSFEYTDQGSLLGHISIGYELLSEKIREISGFPENLALQLKHVLLSHHGEYEQQSPVLPKTLEAVVVYHADNLVSQANAVREIMRHERSRGRDWSDFITIKNRKFYLKRCENGIKK